MNTTTTTSLAALTATKPNLKGKAEPAASATSGGTPSDFLDQEKAASFLATLGVRVAAKTLQKRRSTGLNSPPFRRVGARVVYEPEPLRAWAAAQMSPLVNSTSELPAKPPPLAITTADLAAAFVHPDDTARSAVALAQIEKRRSKRADAGRRTNAAR